MHQCVASLYFQEPQYPCIATAHQPGSLKSSYAQRHVMQRQAWSQVLRRKHHQGVVPVLSLICCCHNCLVFHSITPRLLQQSTLKPSSLIIMHEAQRGNLEDSCTVKIWQHILIDRSLSLPLPTLMAETQCMRRRRERGGHARLPSTCLVGIAQAEGTVCAACHC